MNFIRKLIKIFEIIFSSIIIVFSFIWNKGFYYFQNIIGILAIIYIILIGFYFFAVKYKNKKCTSHFKFKVSNVRALFLIIVKKAKNSSFLKSVSRIFKKRKYNEVLEEIYYLLPAVKKEKLNAEIVYWSPESHWIHLASFIDYNVPRNSDDVISVKIYSVLWNKNEEKVRKLFEKQQMQRIRTLKKLNKRKKLKKKKHLNAFFDRDIY